MQNTAPHIDDYQTPSRQPKDCALLHEGSATRLQPSNSSAINNRGCGRQFRQNAREEIPPHSEFRVDVNHILKPLSGSRHIPSGEDFSCEAAHTSGSQVDNLTLVYPAFNTIHHNLPKLGYHPTAPFPPPPFNSDANHSYPPVYPHHPLPFIFSLPFYKPEFYSEACSKDCLPLPLGLRPGTQVQIANSTLPAPEHFILFDNQFEVMVNSRLKGRFGVQSVKVCPKSGQHWFSYA
ncbi:hypothetical protein TWF102_008302 [Orbilia oligospora]|uniref:Uncharacterized protein n=1 Tax=Orbilia oligospora TaxID=2813651 RepID=A0A7C8J3Y5_ORBOL|nr:hypothetical protein TWF706_001280 [Orbilia oligospora]KAF3092803.1 hypothetical protein TWF102_008302 [Orbilia oligospora]KAF3093677.1 hypothetical protein TWF103_010748 [Orbilia oligospora]